MINPITIQNQHQSYGLWKLHSIIKHILVIIDKKRIGGNIGFIMKDLPPKRKQVDEFPFFFLSLLASSSGLHHLLLLSFPSPMKTLSLSLSKKTNLRISYLSFFFSLILYISKQSPNLLSLFFLFLSKTHLLEIFIANNSPSTWGVFLSPNFILCTRKPFFFF